MKKVLIDNCVPLNNGDAALIFGLYRQLEKKNFSVSFSCLNKKEVKKKYPNFIWNKSHINTFFYRICFKKNLFVFLWKFVMFIKLVILNNEYKQNDVIISAPGGYIHSYYGIEGRMFILYLCRRWLHKNVGIYSQSIGNLSFRDQKIFYKYGKDLNFILARDTLSFDRIKSYGNFTNTCLTKDAAFLLMEDKTPALVTRKKTVAISLRNWKREGRSMEQYFNLIHSAVEHLLQEGYDITFLSTCQGIEDYTDDSIIAKEFVSQFHYENRDNVHVLDSYYDLESLQTKIKSFDFVIGTRLHMCLLSWINQVPAFNISYEEKGKESFKYLGIEQYSIDFNSHYILSKLKNFLSITDKERRDIVERVKTISNEQKGIFEQLVSTDFSKIYK